MSAREKVAMALQAAESNALEKGAIPGYSVFADAAIAAHLEALGAGGVAVVELPKPDGDEFTFNGRDYVFAHDGEVHGKYGTEFGPPVHVRAFAAALLAAADAAAASLDTETP